jgi:hypothetical protein
MISEDEADPEDIPAGDYPWDIDFEDKHNVFIEKDSDMRETPGEFGKEEKFNVDKIVDHEIYWG